MQHPEKWRETADPFKLPFKNFELKEILGYPHAGNDVFHVKGFVGGKEEVCTGVSDSFDETKALDCKEITVFIKIARRKDTDIKNEVDVINKINCPLAPEIIDYDENNGEFIVTAEKEGERLSTIVGSNENLFSLDYMYEYGQTLARLHNVKGDFAKIKDRKYFHIPDEKLCEELDLRFVYDFLVKNQPKTINECFCHGDFHYANVLWKDGRMSAILDFELSGWGNKEFDIAWAIIARPGQRFLLTKQEIDLFMEGYLSTGSFNRKYVEYYMVQIYVYFYNSCDDMPGYREYVKGAFAELCK